MEHLENLEREKNLSGLPPVTQETAERFFERIDRKDNAYAEWKGELYLECHRGTYTSQARSKKRNRQLELALRDAEFLASLAWLEGGVKYPAENLERIWKELLLYQFHDALPGSSIKRVYDESLARYARLLEETDDLIGQSLSAIGKRVDTTGISNPALVFNSLSWDRTEWVRIGKKWTQVQAPALGWASVETKQAPADFGGLIASEKILENDVLRVRFDKYGWIVSVYDKENKREVLAPKSRGNHLVVYVDTVPGPYGAWDYSDNYDARPPRDFRLESAEARVDGPKAILTQTRLFGTSRLTQEIVLTAGSRRLDFVTEVDWRETEKMLRSQFPVAVTADEATCEIQFGHLKRPTHRNTSWDQAKFEICAHKWIDMSDRNYGVALLNDCKYGHKVLGNLMDINLLRSPTYPDPKADKAVHHFTYSLYPHAGDHVTGGVIEAGYELNVPLRVVPIAPASGPGACGHPLVRIESSQSPCPVIVEAVKKAEDSEDLIVRLYEAQGGSTEVGLRFGFKVEKVELVDLMEENGEELKVQSGAVRLSFRGFEIHTVKVTAGG
ncbi:hypothetical protein HQ520_03300 [bacterium]|nr:hypothetical protein [bacterium]